MWMCSIEITCNCDLHMPISNLVSHLNLETEFHKLTEYSNINEKKQNICHTPRQPATYFYIRRIHITYIINNNIIKPHIIP
jgi:hypothetical protein